MTWDEIVWVNDQAPAINATNLNDIMDALKGCYEGDGGGADVELLQGLTPGGLFAAAGAVTVGYNNLCTYDAAEYDNLAAALTAAMTANPYKTIHYVGGNRALGADLTGQSNCIIDFHGAQITLDGRTVGIDASAATNFVIKNAVFTLSSHGSTNTIIGMKTGTGNTVENCVFEWLYTAVQLNGPYNKLLNVTIRYGIDTGIDTISSAAILYNTFNNVLIQGEFDSSYGFNTAGIRLRSPTTVSISGNRFNSVTIDDIHGPGVYLSAVGGNEFNGLAVTNEWNEGILATSSSNNLFNFVKIVQDSGNGASNAAGINFTNTADSNLFSNVLVQYTKGAGIYAAESFFRNMFINVYILGGVSVTTPVGIDFNTYCSGNCFNGLIVKNIAGNAVHLTSANQNSFIGGICHNNSGAGFYIENANETTIIGNKILTAHTYCVQETGTSNKTKFAYNLCKEFTTAAVLLVGANSYATDNEGYNPVGPLSSQPTLPASGVSWTNTYGVPLDIFISGGVVSAINIAKTGGTPAATGLTSGHFRLQPGSMISITYSSAPAWYVGEF